MKNIIGSNIHDLTISNNVIEGVLLDQEIPRRTLAIGVKPTDDKTYPWSNKLCSVKAKFEIDGKPATKQLFLGNKFSTYNTESSPPIKELGDGWFSSTEYYEPEIRWIYHAWGEQGEGAPKIRITNLKIEEGPISTLYTPALEDDPINAIPLYIGKSLTPSDDPEDYVWEPNPEHPEVKVNKL